ncbi:collagen alpha-1(XIII) chain-like [Spea bombifrons]|uniref:collagen alpha-1(XIII) chain-like n=1 Tax=Spea bombifrons TaxID=233779 RepID=UPI002349CFE0|nr:collagen alpha-1(XIII) chain-like [Spea bombifrons]
MEGKEGWRGAASNVALARSSNDKPPRTGDCRKCSRFPALLGCGFAMVSVFSLVLSLLVHFRTSDLQSRVSHLEKQRYTQLSALVSTDQMEAAILGRVDQLLEEKLKSHIPKLREARDTSIKCLCPPGPPGARGKRGHNGEKGIVCFSLKGYGNYAELHNNVVVISSLACNHLHKDQFPNTLKLQLRQNYFNN